MLVVADGQREHGLLVVGVQQRLPVLRVEDDEVLLEELPHNISSGCVAQERGLGHRQLESLVQIESYGRRQLLAVLRMEKVTR